MNFSKYHQEEKKTKSRFSKNITLKIRKPANNEKTIMITFQDEFLLKRFE